MLKYQMQEELKSEWLDYKNKVSPFQHHLLDESGYEFELRWKGVFYDSLVQRALIYDPMDRPIVTVNNEQAPQNIRTDDLKKQIINQTPRINASQSRKLNVPLKTSQFINLK